MYGKHSCARQAPVMRLDGMTASVTQLGRRCNGRFQQPPHLHDGIFRIHLHHNTMIVSGTFTGEVTQHAVGASRSCSQCYARTDSDPHPKCNAFDDAEGAQNERKIAGYLERVAHRESVELLQHLSTSVAFAEAAPRMSAGAGSGQGSCHA